MADGGEKTAVIRHVHGRNAMLGNLYVHSVVAVSIHAYAQEICYDRLRLFELLTISPG